MKDREPYEWPAIMRVVIGSQAHGLADENSDWDHREVFVIPTQRIIASGIYGVAKDAYSSEGSKDGMDESGWEVGKLITMAMHGHPNTIEVFHAPDGESGFDNMVDPEKASYWANRLRGLVPAIVPQDKFADASLNYANNCIVKLLDPDPKTNRRKKWAAAYLRSLIACRDYLKTGVWPVVVREQMSREDAEMIVEARAGELGNGYVVDAGDRIEREIKVLKEDGTHIGNGVDKALALRFLTELRQEFWEWTDA